MKSVILHAIILAFINFSLTANTLSANPSDSIQKNTAVMVKFGSSITAAELKTHLYTFASDEFEGRYTGEPGQKKAAEYLKNYYTSQEISSPFGGADYFQEIPTEHLRPSIKPSENVVGFIKGSHFPDEVIVISAHYDHVGKRDGKIYNGADDDGSGTVAILEIAEAFKNAANQGKFPKRSILFLHVTGEERGLLGSKYYVKFPIFPLEKTVVNLNIDMIGRVDEAHKNNPDFVYLIGSNRLSTELHDLSESVNERFTKLTLDYRYNDENDPNRFYYRSDHYNFAKNNIPVIFYFNGVHEDYHRATDTPEKINYDLLQKRTQLIFYTAWEIANRAERIKVDDK